MYNLGVKDSSKIGIVYWDIWFNKGRSRYLTSQEGVDRVLVEAWRDSAPCHYTIPTDGGGSRLTTHEIRS